MSNVLNGRAAVGIKRVRPGRRACVRGPALGTNRAGHTGGAAVGARQLAAAMLVDGTVRRSSRISALDLSEAAAATAAAATAARKRADAARAHAAAKRRGIVRSTANQRQRPQSAPFRHSRSLESVQRQLDHEYRVARLSKSRADEDLMAVLHSRMDSQAASFAKLLWSVERERAAENDRSTVSGVEAEDSARLDTSLWARSRQQEPDPEPEQTLGLIDHVEVDAVRFACLSSMDNAIHGAREANDRARMLAQKKAAREIGPRVTAARAATRAAQRRKLEAARLLEMAKEQQSALKAKNAAVVLAMAQGLAAQLVATAVEEAAEQAAAKEAAKWQKDEATRVALQSAQEAEAEAAAKQAAEEESERVAEQRRVEARERLAAAAQYAREEAALVTNTARLRGQALVRAVANRSTGRIRHNVAPRESMFQQYPGRLGRGDKAANAELARVALLWQHANEDMPTHRVPALFLRTGRGV